MLVQDLTVALNLYAVALANTGKLDDVLAKVEEALAENARLQYRDPHSPVLAQNNEDVEYVRDQIREALQLR